MKSVYDAGRAAGLQVDHIYTPGWSAGTTTVSPDGEGSDKQLTFANVVLEAGETYSGDLPTSGLPKGVTKRELQAVVAYRCADACSEKTPILEQRSAVDITSKVADGRITWTAPDDGTWTLVTGWMTGTGHSVGLAGTAKTTYLVDHFSTKGFDAIRDYWQDEVLTPELERSIEKSGGSIFFDSLELNSNGNQVRAWTGDFLKEFQKRRGYSLVPYIAAIGVTDPAYEFDGDVGRRVREDYRTTLSELFRDNHLKPLLKWAHQRHLTVRGQPYSSWGPTAIDTQEMATLLDVTEGEDRSFNSGSDVDPLLNRSADSWRSLASAVAQSGRDRVSTECCAEGQAQRVARSTLVSRVNQQVVNGVNMFVWHGWGDSTEGAASSWPGFSLFGGGVGDAYGPHSPTWSDDATLNDYTARLQTVMRRGELRDDVAIYRQGGGHSKDGATGDAYFTDQSLARAGYTYGFMDQDLVTDKNAEVSHGRLLAKSLSYKAFVLNNTENVNYETALDLDSARRILSWAKAGLPIVVVGDPVLRTRGLNQGADAALRRVLAELRRQSTVQQVAEESDVLPALRTAEVEPAASYTGASDFLNLRRESGDTDYYYFWNSGKDRETTTVTLTGSGRPYRYDPWTGEVTPIAAYTRTADGVRVEVSAASGDGVLLALTKGNEDTRKLPKADVSVLSTTADAAVVADDGEVRVRASAPGTYATRLSDGRTVVSRVTSVTAARPLTDWSLDVRAYVKGDTASRTRTEDLGTFTVTAGPDGSLPDWQHIAGLESRSGTSTYRSALDLDSSFAEDAGAYLDLGRVEGTYTVEINGRALPEADLLDASSIDVSGFVRPGRNVVEVHVATLLGNAAYDAKQPYGLVGPVVVRPYAERTVSGKGH
nr:glycosyl hydrolase [Streptomyces adustus]